MIQMKPFLVFLAALAFALSPLLSTGFNGFRPDQFPIPQINAPVQPAGYAFSIWGVIYLMLIAGAGFGLLRRAGNVGWDTHRTPLILSLGIGAGWIPVAQLSAFWATVMIWLMLGTALFALLRLPRIDRIWLRTPVALYAGWLTAASCVALALMLAGHGLTGATPSALLCLTLGLAIAATIQNLRPDIPEYSAAVIWALTGVALSNIEPFNPAVLTLCGVGILALAGVVWRGRSTA